MLTSIALLWLLGMALGAAARKLHLPALVGMLLAGILLGPFGADLLSPALLSVSADLRRLALILILLRAGLSLDLGSLRRSGRSAVLLCFLPAACEVLGMVLLAPRLLGVSVLDAAILGARLAETIFPPSRIRNEIRKGTDALWSRNNGSGDDFMLLAALVSNGSPAKINPEIFQTVFEAWRQHSRLQIRYCRVRDGHVSELLIEPHVLTLFDNVWYIRAKLLRSGEKRLENPEFLNFALARILGAILSEGHFEPDRKEIDRVNSGHLFDIPHIAEVKLKVSKQALRYAAEYMPVADCRQNPDGTCTLTLKDIEAYRVSHFILMSGGDAVILSPVELIRNTLDMAEKYIARQHETQNVSDEQV